MAGGTQASLARKSGLSQNAIWKLLTGATKHPSYGSSVSLEEAVDSQISRLEFMESTAEELKTAEPRQLEIMDSSLVPETNANTAGGAV